MAVTRQLLCTIGHVPQRHLCDRCPLRGLRFLQTVAQALYASVRSVVYGHVTLIASARHDWQPLKGCFAPSGGIPSSMSSNESFRFATRCATVKDPAHLDQYGASCMPVYMTATFKGLPGAEYDYTRAGNPTRSVLEHHLAQLQQCKYTLAVNSGMACLDVIMRFVRPGEHVLAGDDLYGGSNRLLDLLKRQMDLKIDNVDTTDTSVIERTLEERSEDHRAGRGSPVSLVLLESPTNPMIKICDLPQSVRLVRKYAPEAIIVVDNTMLSPYLMNPLEMGVDIVYDSATKYLSGHHDIMAGVIACNRDDLAEKMAFTIKSVGNGLNPMDSFSLLRGVKTLALRMDRQQASALRIAAFLHELGFRVNYPGLRSHPGHAVHMRQARGFGGVLSFESGNKVLSERIVAATRLWGVSVSFGCVNSLISMPCLMSHASIDPKVRAERGLPENLIRLCVGIEDAEDLLADLTQALVTAGAIRAKADGSFERVPVEDEMKIFRQQLRSAGITSAVAEPAAPPAELTVSAPGKVILFGEHAVVHGVTAIAAATALRCYAHVAPRTDDRVALVMPDIELTAEWDAAAVPVLGALDAAPTTLNDGLVAQLAMLAPYAAGDRRHAACLAFLYLYVHLATRPSAQSFTIRSSLPISAGLGSSAAVSTCLASLLLYTHGHLALPTHAEESLTENDISTVNAWAFVSEKVIHGEPSGVDNTVATYGGAVAFTRALPNNALESNALVPMSGFEALRLLITDTRVERNTKELVAHISAQKGEDPIRSDAAFATIQLISEDAQAVLRSPTTPRKELVSRLGRLMDLNHLQLVQMHVGHPALEQVRTVAAQRRLHTKLTGAGGGGCAISLVNDDLDSAELDALCAELHALGFATYETKVGGPGLGVLVQPGTPASDVSVEQSNAALAHVASTDLAAWAHAAGTWAFA